MKTSPFALVALVGIFAVATLSSCTTNVDATPSPSGSASMTTTTQSSPYVGSTTTQRRTTTTQY